MSSPKVVIVGSRIMYLCIMLQNIRVQYIRAGIFKQFMLARNRVGIGCRTGPPGYTVWRSWFLGIDRLLGFKNSSSQSRPSEYFTVQRNAIYSRLPIDQLLLTTFWRAFLVREMYAASVPRAQSRWGGGRAAGSRTGSCESNSVRSYRMSSS